MIGFSLRVAATCFVAVCLMVYFNRSLADVGYVPFSGGAIVLVGAAGLLALFLAAYESRVGRR